jgi:hypothetical protein
VSKHTPGPWYVEDRRPGGGVMQVQAPYQGPGSSYCVASINYWRDVEANARLIAAAPEMLDALKLASQELSQYLDLQRILDYREYAAGTQKKLDEITALIAKAEGNLDDN